MQISKLSNMEAVYSLRELTRDVDSGINLADEPSVRAYVKTAAERALSDPAKISEFMALFEKPETAADVARAVLASVEEEPELIEDQAAKLHKIFLADPPRTQQMDMGISLGLLALAGMAMFLSGSLKIKTKDFDLNYQGNAQVIKIFEAVLPKIPGWMGG